MRARYLVLCSSLLLSTGVSARQPGDQLTVIASPEKEMSYEKWQDRTANRLTGSIRRAGVAAPNRKSTTQPVVPQSKPSPVQPGPSSGRK